MDETASYWTGGSFFAMALCVVGPDFVTAIGYIYISTVVESWEVAVAGASLQYFLSLAFVAGPSLSTLIYKSLVFKKHGSALTQEESRKNADLLESLRASFWFWAALCFSSTIVTLLFLRDMGKTSGKVQSKVAEEDTSATENKPSSTPDATSDSTVLESGIPEKKGDSQS
ncbi:hypothetical protein QFC22_004182 [Naganishia vaughanmartiniae]|uniref:Uncharacterized protein n=1 Tax=Naganishia vaughanmartiniae TaxID=1424756 RepID=A0ACC2X5E7_9TREE|nr:hypothetical protein QFC22_004182 [Naganishia vaughanmartiniae]